MAETARQEERDPAVLAAALDAADSAVLVFEDGKGVILSNPAAVELLGLPPVGIDSLEEWEQGCGFHSDEPTVKRPRQRSTLEELPWNRARRGEAVHRACYFLRNSQQRSGAWVQVNASVDSGRVVVSLRDISTRRRAELALKSSRRMTRVLFQESPAPIVRTALDGKIVACNKAFAKMVGHAAPAEICSLQLMNFIGKALHDSAMTELVSKGRVPDKTFKFRKQDGSTGTAIANLQLVEPAPGESDWSVVTTMVDLNKADVTDPETHLLTFLKFFPGVAFIQDKSGEFIYLNDSLKALPQLSHQLQKPDEAFLKSGRMIRSTEEVVFQEGAQRWSVYKFPIPNADGEPQWVGGVGLNDTGRLQRELRVQELQRMEALGRLAGGVAHEFNNFLTVIAGYAQMLKDSTERRMPYEQLQVYPNELIAATGRCKELTDRLLTFGNRQQVRLQRVNLNELLTSTARLLKRVLGDDIDLQVQVCLEDCFIRADQGLIKQVITNLVMNAREAMPAGGRLEIETSLTEHAPDGTVPGRYAVLRVSDTGVGMDSETLSRIFEPFFTSKPKLKGTGFGLSTVYGIIKQIGGEIVVKSEPGLGSVFQIYFGESSAFEDELPRRKIANPAAVRTLAGNETILIVEDDENVRELVKTMLERNGFKTLTAEDGRDALRVFQDRGAEVQLLLTDVIMPNMSGRELAMRLQRLAPGLRVLYMSGYSPEEVASKGVSVRLNILRKPFDADTLVQRVREVIGQTAVRG